MPQPAAVLIAAFLALGVGLAGCTSTPTPKPSPSHSPAGLTVDQVTKKIADTEPPTRSLAHTTGTIDAVEKVPVTIDVVSLRALPDETLLELRIAAASGTEQDLGSFQLSRPPFLDTRNVGLVDAASGRTYRPYTFVQSRNPTPGVPTGCLCDRLRTTDGTGVTLSMLMPPLPDDVTAVDVTMPGLPKMSAVPVARG
ncbi:hypothetical protein [Microbacterium sp.]|uniref:hypothetical protein n=1 Tax=Microbacterium sp. TaxID=51671 RepID=UPI003A91776C